MSESTKQAKDIVNENLVDTDDSVVDWISSGCTLLDLAIADRLPGGFPIGRTVEIYGPASSGKTVLGMCALGACQRKGGVGYFIDVEDTFHSSWSKLYGLSFDKKVFKLAGGLECPETVEEFFDNYLNGVIELGEKDDRYKLVVVDSLTALSSKVEKDTSLSDATYGATKPKQISAAFRKYSPPVLAKSRTGLIFINQTRDNIGGYGRKEVTSGGRAVAFYCSVRIYLTLGPKIENSKEKVIGVWVNFEVTKNKISAPFRKGSFRIIFDYGLDDIYSNLDFLKHNQDHKKGDNKVDFAGESKLVSTMVKRIEKENLEEDVRTEVQKVWRELYKPVERKRRVWL